MRRQSVLEVFLIINPSRMSMITPVGSLIQKNLKKSSKKVLHFYFRCDIIGEVQQETLSFLCQKSKDEKARYISLRSRQKLHLPTLFGPFNNLGKQFVEIVDDISNQVFQTSIAS